MEETVEIFTRRKVARIMLCITVQKYCNYYSRIKDGVQKKGRIHDGVKISLFAHGTDSNGWINGKVPRH